MVCLATSVALVSFLATLCEHGLYLEPVLTCHLAIVSLKPINSFLLFEKANMYLEEKLGVRNPEWIADSGKSMP